TRQYAPPPNQEWDEDSYRGSAYGSYGWACDVIEVERDPVTEEIRPIRVTAAHEVGRALNPLAVRGQIEGGTAQGLGYALLEEVVLRGGAMANAQFTNYVVPTTLDIPPLDVLILEKPYAHGPFGAKGVGEMPIDGVAPAVVNAIRSLGVDLREIPATPERVMGAPEIGGLGRATDGSSAPGRSGRGQGTRGQGRGTGRRGWNPGASDAGAPKTRARSR
ncbi:MAG TPA: molybdopterin-dependent oxidoreductase, partial [Vicinamibacterales bacterium]|nr:molybdopterin-dependent oxidoreductase [Vicinamibacterales bacterium]